MATREELSARRRKEVDGNNLAQGTTKLYVNAGDRVKNLRAAARVEGREGHKPKIGMDGVRRSV